MDESENEILIFLPFPGLFRLFLGGFGVLTCVWPTWDLWRGVWPPNLFTPFFGILLGGAWSIGLAMIGAALFGPSRLWRATPGLLELETRALFGPPRRRFLCPDDDPRFLTERVEDDEGGPPRWRLMVIAREGGREEIWTFATQAAAETLRLRLEALLFGAGSG